MIRERQTGRQAMNVITLNVNGMRSALRKGLWPWLQRQRADFICLQEVRARPGQLPDEVVKPRRYHAFFNPARRDGYSGVALYSRHEPERVERTLGWPCADEEGRFLRVDYGRLSVVSLYLPSGTSGPERQELKFDFMARFTDVIGRMRRSRRNVILCGDWNIAHKPIDLKNWRANQVHSGFLPEERAWLDKVFGELGMVDAFRVVNGEAEQYTWWSSRGRAWEKNVGWRIDYQVVTPGLRRRIRSAAIYRARRFSDHAPLIMRYDYDL